MSVKVMSWVWDNATVEGTALLVLLAIADHANDDGVCWPSVARLAQRARVQQRQAQYIINQLEEAEVISIERGTGRGRTSVYTINVLKGAEQCTHIQTERVQSNAPIALIKGAVQRERVQSSAIKGAVRSHAHVEPTMEPPLTTTITAPPAAPVQHPVPESAVDVYRHVTRQRPNEVQREQITAAVQDIDKWREILEKWMEHKWRPTNVSEQLDVYRNGWRKNGSNGRGKPASDMEVDASSYIQPFYLEDPDGVRVLVDQRKGTRTRIE